MHELPEIVGSSPAIIRVRQLVSLAARTDVNVLVTGETGTGKELVARAIHRGSVLAAGPFVAHSCAHTAPELFDVEFFGHRRGAFPGAARDRPGLLRMASGGVLFLDELECLTLPSQAKLLRVLDDGTHRPVGSDEPEASSVRFFAATNRSPSSLLTAGELRADLYYRLRGLEIHLPALRERPEDIALLAESFLEPGGKRLAPAALHALRHCSWPGNVRQLRSTVRFGVTAAGGPRIEVQDLNLGALAAPAALTAVAGAQLSLAEAERQVIVHALALHQGNRSRAAEALGIHRSTLRRRIRELGLDGSVDSPRR